MHILKYFSLASLGAVPKSIASVFLTLIKRLLLKSQRSILSSSSLSFISIVETWEDEKNNVHTYNTRYASKSNFYNARLWTNIGKTKLSALAADHWQKLPHDIKDLNLSIFPRKAKQYLLRKQIQHLSSHNSSISYSSQPSVGECVCVLCMHVDVYILK